MIASCHWIKRKKSASFIENNVPVIQLVGENANYLKSHVLSIFGSKEVVFTNVKYPKRDLENTVQKLDGLKDKIDSDGKTAWGIDTKNNKVVVFSNDDFVKKIVLDNVEVEKVKFAPGIAIYDQVGVGPSKVINDTQGDCVVAFNAKVNNDNVAVTAGHCHQSLNQVWYQGTTNIGTFTNVASAVDAGYIKLNSNATTSYIDSTTNTPIVGIAPLGSDFQGLTLIVSAGGTQIPIKVEIVGVTIGALTNQQFCSFTSPIMTKGGHSGSPVVHRYYESSSKRYEEVVYGIHKGLAELQDGSGIVLEIYGNAGHAFSQLGLSSVIKRP